MKSINSAFLSQRLSPQQRIRSIETITTLDDHSSMVLKEFNAIYLKYDGGVHVKMIIGNGNVKSSTSETLQKEDLIL